MIHIRVLFRNPQGTIVDGGIDFDLTSFAGQVPLIGDMILDPGVPQGLDRNLPQNRQVWTVVGRVFNPRDTEDCVALIVETRDGNVVDEAFL
tara:strand:+ start:72993 stop:73268 length:276 start_codon:yes stop_codon:yes gene_type:complete